MNLSIILFSIAILGMVIYIVKINDYFLLKIKQKLKDKRVEKIKNGSNKKTSLIKTKRIIFIKNVLFKGRMLVIYVFGMVISLLLFYMLIAPGENKGVKSVYVIVFTYFIEEIAYLISIYIYRVQIFDFYQQLQGKYIYHNEIVKAVVEVTKRKDNLVNRKVSKMFDALIHERNINIIQIAKGIKQEFGNYELASACHLIYDAYFNGNKKRVGENIKWLLETSVEKLDQYKSKVTNVIVYVIFILILPFLIFFKDYFMVRGLIDANVANDTSTINLFLISLLFVIVLQKILFRSYF